MGQNYDCKKIRIGLIVRGLPPAEIGGAEIQAEKLSHYLAGRGYDVTVFITRYNSEFTNKDNYQVRSAPYINFPVLRYFSKIVCSLNEIRKEKKMIHVLICYHFHESALIGSLAKCLFNIPLISSIRGMPCFKTDNAMKKIVNRFIINNSDVILAQSTLIKRAFESAYHISNKTYVIPNGVDTTDNAASGDKIIYVGRLTKDKSNDKGLRYLVMALKDIKVETLIIGEGPEKKELKKQAKGLNIRFIGRVPHGQIMEHLVKGKIFVLPSVCEESFPNAVLEAMSIGLPVIATKVGGIPDIIEHGKTGFLVEPKNSEEIKKYIEMMLKDKELWNKLSKNCREEVKKYSWGNIINKYENVLKRFKK